MEIKIPTFSYFNRIVDCWNKFYCKDHLYKQQRSKAGSWFRSGGAVKNPGVAPRKLKLGGGVRPASQNPVTGHDAPKIKI